MIKLAKIIKNTKRLGRGPASGKGKTSGRGMNGQKSRTGSSTTFRDGGQTNYFMRLPKAKGFRKIEKKYISVNANRLNELFKDGEKVTREEVAKRMKIEDQSKKIKIFSIKSLKIKLDFAEDLIIAKTSEK